MKRGWDTHSNQLISMTSVWMNPVGNTVKNWERADTATDFVRSLERPSRRSPEAFFEPHGVNSLTMTWRRLLPAVIVSEEAFIRRVERVVHYDQLEVEERKTSQFSNLRKEVCWQLYWAGRALRTWCKIMSRSRVINKIVMTKRHAAFWHHHLATYICVIYGRFGFLTWDFSLMHGTASLGTASSGYVFRSFVTYDCRI